jgi:hypothetical protein
LPFFTLLLVYGPEATTCRYKVLLQELVMLCYSFPDLESLPIVLRFFHDLSPSCTLWIRPHSASSPHTIEQGSQPTTSLISTQVVPFQKCGGTYCPIVSTPKTQSLADSSMTIHNTLWDPTVSTIPTLAQTTTSNLTTVTSHHDGWNTNTLNTEHKSKLNIVKMED